MDSENKIIQFFSLTKKFGSRFSDYYTDEQTHFERRNVVTIRAKIRNVKRMKLIQIVSLFSLGVLHFWLVLKCI